MKRQASTESIASWRSMLGLGLLLSACAAPATDSQVDEGEPTSGAASQGDADGDFLSDADEVIWGSDPTDPDTDHDGYLDGHEVVEGSDLLDPEDRIYQGGWPYQLLKPTFGEDYLTSGAVALQAPVELGQQVPRVQLLDQHGDLVDLYDFAGDGRPVVLQLSAAWCWVGWGVADGLWGDDRSDFAEDYPELFGLIASGEVHLLIVYVHGYNEQTPYGDDLLEDFTEAYPQVDQPVMLDDGSLLPLVDVGFPTMLVLDEQLSVQAVEAGLSYHTQEAVLRLLADD